MIELNRRAIVTGLAAVAVAGVVPALPASAVASAPFSPRLIVLNSHWLFQQSARGRILIQHGNSGYGFVNEPRPDGTPVFNCVVPPKAEPDPIWHALERASTFVAKQASLLRTVRRHRGAIYLRYSQRDPRRPFDDVLTEDARQQRWIDTYYYWDASVMEMCVYPMGHPLALDTDD